jgi:hypothetical protein
MKALHNRPVEAVVLMLLSLALVLGAAAVQSCHDGCEPEETRCAGAAVQQCASDGDWYVVEDCADVGPGAWECCEAALEWEGEPTAGCVPIGECGVPDSGADLDTDAFADGCAELVGWAEVCGWGVPTMAECTERAAAGDGAVLCAVACAGVDGTTCADISVCLDGCGGA